MAYKYRNRRKKKKSILTTIILFVIVFVFLAGSVVYEYDNGTLPKPVAELCEKAFDYAESIGLSRDSLKLPWLSGGRDKEEDQLSDSSHDEAGFEIDFIDVGQGNAVLVTCGNEHMLYDAAPTDKGSALRLYLKKHGVQSLKYMFLSHADEDHIGGAASVVSNMQVDNVFLPEFEKDTYTYDNLMNELSYKSMKAVCPEPGAVYRLGEAVITVIAPLGTYPDANNNSIAVRIIYGSTAFMLTGDAQEEEEADMLESGYNLKSDVLLCGHHGSYNASTESFLEKVMPEYAVISCGKDNEYGHPHDVTLRRLFKLGINVLRTDELGTIPFYSDGNSVWTTAR